MVTFLIPLAINSIRSKGSIGLAFTVRTRTESPDQASLGPYALHEISDLVELALGHLRYRLTDVPPQSNSQPESVLSWTRQEPNSSNPDARARARPQRHGRAARDGPARHRTLRGSIGSRRRHSNKFLPITEWSAETKRVVVSHFSAVAHLPLMLHLQCLRTDSD